MYSGFLNDGVLLLNVSLTTSGKDGYCAVRNKQKSVSINNPYFIQFLSNTVSPVLITINIAMYLHFQVPLSLLITL